MIAIALASGLFIKYIFFDKSETFSTSIPPTPTFHSTESTAVSSPVDSTQSTPGCPYALVPRRRSSSLSVNSSILTAATTRVCKNTLQDLGTLIGNGIVVGNGTLASSSTPALTPATTMELGVIPMVGSSGGMTKIKSSSSLQLMGHTSEEVGHVDLPLNPATEMVSIGIQTDLSTHTTTSATILQTPTMDEPIFTIGCSDRRVSVASSGYSGSDGEQCTRSPPPTRAEPCSLNTPTPAEPRNLDMCLAILKSEEVSCWSNIHAYIMHEKTHRVYIPTEGALFMFAVLCQIITLEEAALFYAMMYVCYGMIQC